MRRVVYVSPEAFFDVDFPILKRLNTYYDLIWVPILKRDGWYSVDEISSFCANNDIHCHIVVQKHKYKNPLMIMFYLRLLTKIRSFKPDIIYFEYFGIPILHLISPFFLPIKKVIIAIHDVIQHQNMDYGKLKGLYFNYVYKKFRNFQVFSRTQLEAFKLRAPGKKVFSAELYLKDFGEPTIKRSEVGRVHFLFFGIIRANKGLDILIQAFNEISRKRNDFRVTIAGFTDNWKYYETLIEDESFYNLDIRKIPNREIPNYFCNADYIVLPYLDVTQSGVLLTAYNYNLPAIASDFPGFCEYILNGHNGYLTTPAVQSLVSTIELVLENHKSSNIRENLAKYTANRIRIDRIIENYCHFFDAV